ncbi:MAG: hypothetical protein ACOY4Q_11240 [Bacillota bacterium]
MAGKKAKKRKLKILRHRRKAAALPDKPAPEAPAREAQDNSSGEPLIHMLKDLSPAWQQFYRAVISELDKPV